jgi:hypothetical protein
VAEYAGQDLIFTPAAGKSWDMARPCLVSSARKGLSIAGQFCSLSKAFRTNLSQQAQSQSWAFPFLFGISLKRKEVAQLLDLGGSDICSSVKFVENILRSSVSDIEQTNPGTEDILL